MHIWMAKEVYEDVNAMDQEEVNTAWQNLLDAMANLMLRPDKGLLEDLIAQAESLNEADYDAQSFAVMRAALAAAKETAADETALQDEVDASAAALEDAIAKLTASGSGDDQQSGGTQQKASPETEARARGRQPALQTIRVQLRLQERRQLPMLPRHRSP